MMKTLRVVLKAIVWGVILYLTFTYIPIPLLGLIGALAAAALVIAFLVIVVGDWLGLDLSTKWLGGKF